MISVNGHADTVMDTKEVDKLQLRPTFYVECCLRPESTLKYENAASMVENWLRKTLLGAVQTTTIISRDRLSSLQCANDVESLRICECSDVTASSQGELHLSSCNMSVFVYQLADDEPVEEMNEEENVMTSHHLVLPSRTLEGLWESLVFDDEIQTQLLDYITTTMEFSDCAVDPNIISWNRVVLLYGPPGTGKTSLCRALAHKLSVRLSNRFAYGKLIEINSHSLFSKWFSESGKLVMKMFSTISELASDDDAFVTVLIDEVESLTAARRAAVGGSEPSDAVRVVNALLTQIDQIKKRKNVLIVTTSNVTEAIDLAFVDRADIKHYIAPPSARAVYTILCSCISELVRTGIVLSDGKLLDWKEIELFRGLPPTINPHRASIRLASVADKCAALQLSGRTLRRLPFLAHAHFVRRRGVSGEVFVEALEKALESEGIAREIMRREGERPHEGKSNAS